MNNKEPGYVYILTNPSSRKDWVKIGKSSRPVDVRSKELDNTAVMSWGCSQHVWVMLNAENIDNVNLCFVLF